MNCLMVGIGGFIGAVCRYLIGLIPTDEITTFPIKTLIINVVGAFIIGAIAAIALKNQNLSPKVVLLLKTGFCGGFTTFSTFALESYDLMNSGKWQMAFLYMVLSVVLSISAVMAAEMMVGR